MRRASVSGVEARLGQGVVVDQLWPEAHLGGDLDPTAAQLAVAHGRMNVADVEQCPGGEHRQVDGAAFCQYDVVEVAPKRSDCSRVRRVGVGHAEAAHHAPQREAVALPVDGFFVDCHDADVSAFDRSLGHHKTRVLGGHVADRYRLHTGHGHSYHVAGIGTFDLDRSGESVGATSRWRRVGLQRVRLAD
jgi:hypothetical protein